MMEAAVRKAPLLRGGNWTEATGHRSAGKENSRVRKLRTQIYFCVFLLYVCAGIGLIQSEVSPNRQLTCSLPS